MGGLVFYPHEWLAELADIGPDFITRLRTYLGSRAGQPRSCHLQADRLPAGRKGKCNAQPLARIRLHYICCCLRGQSNHMSKSLRTRACIVNKADVIIFSKIGELNEKNIYGSCEKCRELP